GSGLTIARLGRVLVSAGRVDEALELMRTGLAEAGDGMGGVARAELHGQLARALMLHNELDPSVVAADRALEAAAPLDLVGVIALIRLGAVMRIDAGQWDEALTDVAAAEEDPMPPDMQVSMTHVRALIGALRGDTAGVERLLSKTDTLLVDISNPTYLAVQRV